MKGDYENALVVDWFELCRCRFILPVPHSPIQHAFALERFENGQKLERHLFGFASEAMLATWASFVGRCCFAHTLDQTYLISSPFSPVIRDLPEGDTPTDMPSAELLFAGSNVAAQLPSMRHKRNRFGH
mmetsp:Transcript_39620/g.85777  ORF Transcript_39620/g.85777 Transcript_39620/m.85777 type:complete len:129 (+) Transcript_39620:879-1265(+)